MRLLNDRCKRALDSWGPLMDRTNTIQYFELQRHKWVVKPYYSPYRFPTDTTLARYFRRMWKEYHDIHKVSAATVQRKLDYARRHTLPWEPPAAVEFYKRKRQQFRHEQGKASKKLKF